MTASNRMTRAEFAAQFEVSLSGRAIPKTGAGVGNGITHPKQKYSAQPTVGPSPGAVEGRRYDSRLGARLALRLTQEVQLGDIVGWIPEVSVPVGTRDDGKAMRHRIDALVILSVNADGTFVGQWVEAKGHDTKTGQAKRGAFRRLYGVPVHLTKTGEPPHHG